MRARDLLRVLGLWRPRAGWLLLGAGVAALSALSALALLAAAGLGVGEALAEGAVVGAAAALLLLLRPLILLRPLLRWAERTASHAATFRALADTRVWFFRRLAERLPAGPGNTRAGDLLARMVSDVESLDGFYLRVLVPFSAAGAVVAAVAALLGAASPGLAAVIVLPLALALLLPLAVAPFAARAAARAAEAGGAMRAEAVEPLTALEDVLGAGAEGRATARLRAAAERSDAARRRLSRAGALGGAAGALLAQAALLGALAWGLAGGGGGPAAVVLALFLALAAADSLGALPRAGSALALAAAGARRLFEAADRPPPVAEPRGPSPVPAGHAVSVRGLRFAWAPDREAVFEDLSLDLPEGGRLALLGPSGSGKSTLAALLLKLAEPQGGRITLGGADYARLPVSAVRARIACLTQEATLFDDSVAANLRLADPDAPDSRLWEALERARVAEVVRALPEGLETRCGEQGARFSGGQARRLALARTLLSPAPILLLDEPGAGLDEEAERAFLADLDSALAGRSAILVTHRLLGVERPTRILRLAGGRALPAAA